MIKEYGWNPSYIATGEVTTLKHEVGDDAVEGRAGVAKALLAGAESPEVLGSLGDNVAVEVEVDTARLGCQSKESQLAKKLIIKMLWAKGIGSQVRPSH